jgi:ABC-type glycerol-3-phosphate transport system permease component
MAVGRIRKIALLALFYLFLAFMSLIVLIPLVWVLGNALRPNGEIGMFTGLSANTFVPRRFTAENFVNIFGQLNMLGVISNTVFVAATVTAASLFVNGLAAYALARIGFAGKKIAFALIIALLVLPIEILIIPLYLTISAMGLKNSFASLILPFIATPFGIFFLRQFFMNIPRALDEAAILDGCGHFGIFRAICLPLSKTPLITLGLLSFLQQWDSFIVPVTFIDSESKMLLQVALTRLAIGLYANDYGVMFAGVAISVVPMLALFLFFQRHIVENFATAGIKG